MDLLAETCTGLITRGREVSARLEDLQMRDLSPLDIGTAIYSECPSSRTQFLFFLSAIYSLLDPPLSDCFTAGLGNALLHLY